MRNNVNNENKNAEDKNNPHRVNSWGDMKCLACGEACEYLFNPDSLYPPISGTMFESTGNYGSTVWDMEGRMFLQTVICDPCLIKHADRVNVVKWDAKTLPPKEFLGKIDFKQFRDDEGYKTPSYI